MDDNKTKRATDSRESETTTAVIEKVRRYMCSGEGYSLTPVDYLVLSGLMMLVELAVKGPMAEMTVTPLACGAALVFSYLAFKSALATRNKRLLFTALVFVAIDLFSLFTQRGCVEGM